MSFVRILVHAVWTTKNRESLLGQDKLVPILDHTKEYAASKEIVIDRINGYQNHIHILFWLNAYMPVSKAIQLLKGESSFWINRQGMFLKRFSWNDEYFAGSVSPSALPAVRRYIDSQQVHHRKISFDEEYKKFLEEFLDDKV